MGASPPRVRGKDNKIDVEDICYRITPARAGKSLKQYQKAVQNKDHPRACGEKLSINKPTNDNKGSPPRVRGKAIF